ncbi:MAG: O-antigen ligase family protein [Crocinitomicaceae bacterium]|nr:O-antigen ligase family protein [Crocinitomicaceae bacterium]
MEFVRKNSWILFWSCCYLLIASYLIWNNQEFLSLFPVGLIAIFAAIYYTEKTFLALAFLTPLSINIENYTDGFGLFIPTEPLLFGFLLLFMMQQIYKNTLVKEVWKSPIVWFVCLYLGWVFIASVLSTNPIVSLKFLLAHLWLVVPLLFFGPIFFSKQENRIRFLWLFSFGMSIAIIYTLIIHAQYGFGEKESHWVSWPFFKDHTIYGATIAIQTPLVFGLYFYKKHSPLVQFIVVTMILINLLGLYFSHTRAAWLSIIAALGVMLLIRFKIKFKWIALVVLIVGTTALASWTQISHYLEQNRYEHTTEDFGERVQSVSNVTTDASNLERINRWQCAIDMFLEKPITGFGPGTYAFEYARFQRPENLTIISTNFGDLGNAHSEYLSALSEMGIFGLLFFIAVVAAIFYQSITLYVKWPKEDRENRVVIMSIILSLTTYFTHAFLNNFLDTDKAAVPIWGMCAMIIAMQATLRKGIKKTDFHF